MEDATPSPEPLDRFRALALADGAVARALGEFSDGRVFAQRAMGIAAAQDIALTQAMLDPFMRPDPLGVSRWTVIPLRGAQWPSEDWLPIQVQVFGDDAVIDWAYFGDAALTGPFYEDSVRRVLARPLNRMLRYRMVLADFTANAPAVPPPTGLIFHMSRCGSTLVSQMLAALPRSMVVSEAAPIDAIVQLSRQWPHLTEGQHARNLAAMTAAFCRKPGARIFKLDSWHTLALPLFRRAFPAVPWVFLYRDPVEVLVSQMRQRGSQTVPEMVAPALYGIEDFGGAPDEDYCARVLERTCAAVLDRTDAAALVNYSELPQAVWTRILPHFAMTCSDADIEAMRAAARNDAKSPRDAFAADSEGKQREASPALRAAAETHLSQIYGRLEALRDYAMRTGSLS